MGRVGEVRYLERRRGVGIRTLRKDGYSNLGKVRMDEQLSVPFCFTGVFTLIPIPYILLLFFTY